MKFIVVFLLTVFLSLPIFSQAKIEFVLDNTVDTPRASKVLQRIREFGEIKVAVDIYYPPFSFLDIDGEIAGLEIDLASDVAKRLNVNLVLVQTTNDEKMNALFSNEVDLVISHFQENDFRYGEPFLIIPAYYNSAYVVFGKKDQPLSAWKGLFQKKVCAVRNAYVNNIAQQEYLLNLSTFDYAHEIAFNLKNNTICDVWLYDEAYIKPLLYQPEWISFDILLQSKQSILWHLAINPNEAETDYSQLLSKIVNKWFTSSYLSDLEWKWRIPYSTYIKSMEKIYAEADSQNSIKY